MIFAVGNIRRHHNDYGGHRFKARATIGGLRTIAIDIGFGDALEPEVEAITNAALLDLLQPHLRAYAPETVIAEKFEASASIGSLTAVVRAIGNCLIPHPAAARTLQTS